MAETATEAFGPYLVYEQLGIGGMASVHRAEVPGSLGFARSIALKRMLPHVASNEDMVRAFVREARLASHLRHANVAQTYELGKVGEIYFIAMELVLGRNLREILKHCGKTTGPMPVPIALNILNQICDALDYAHNLCDETGQPLGIIHRDVTPSNIIVSEGGVVKLIDFGIAKASAAGMQTMSGTIKGKFGYMAPEYIAGSIDARADLFALGVIAHELLTNRPLFAARDDLETLTRVQNMEVMPPSHRNPEVPPEIDDIVMTALSRDPDRRWQQATALRSALTTVTRRLGLTVLGSQVTDWLEHMFEDTDPNATMVDAHMSMTLEAGTAEYPTSQLNLITPIVNPPPPPSYSPNGTPSRITAQKSIPPGGTSPPGSIFGPPRNQSIPPTIILEADEPPKRESAPSLLAGYARHDELVPSASRVSSPQIVLQALARASEPKLGDFVQSSPQIPVPQQPQQRQSGLQPVSQRQSGPQRTLLSHSGAQIAIPQHSGPQIAIPQQSSPQIAIQQHSSPQIAIQQHSSPQIALPQHPSERGVQPTPIPRPSASGAAQVAPRRGSRFVAVVLILLAAAGAAAVVYFVLPLLTNR